MKKIYKQVIGNYLMLALLFFISTASFSQTPLLLKDINPTGGSTYEGTALTVLNGVAYFAVDDGVHGLELWKTNGTASGTTMVLQIDTSSFSGCSTEMVVMNNKLYFEGHSNLTSGWELWTSNGTAAGTHIVKEINTTTGSNPYQFFVSNGKVFFTADDGVHGREIWVSDGTSGGTKLLYDVAAGTATGFQTGLFINSMGSNTYFMGSDFTNGTQMWRTDGTPAGTQVVTHMNAGGGGSYFRPSLVFNNQIVSSSNDSTYGTELWVSDGTTAGTHLLKDINPGSGGGCNGQFTELNSKFYFQGNDGVHGWELWASDGTTSGTSMVKDINPGSAFSFPTYLHAYNNKIYFAADDGIHGYELWSSDGTASGTTLVKDINPTGASSITSFTNYNGRLYFAANNGTDGLQLHQYVSATNVESQVVPASFNPNALQYSFVAPVFSPVLGDLFYMANYNTTVSNELYHFVTVPLGIESLQHDDLGLSISPNPASQSAVISWELAANKNSQVKFFDAMGKQVFQSAVFSQQLTVDVSKFENGIYFIQLTSENKTSTQKLIVQH